LRLLTATALFAAEAALAMTLLALAPAPSGAQFFEDRFLSRTAGSVDRSTGSNHPRSRRRLGIIYRRRRSLRLALLLLRRLPEN
jgi:hypothetical protein